MPSGGKWADQIVPVQPLWQSMLLILQLLKVSESAVAVSWCNRNVLGAASVAAIVEVEAMHFAFISASKQHVACRATTECLFTQ